MERFYPIPTKDVHGKKAIISACQKKSPGKPSKTGRFLGGIRLSGMLRSEIALVLRKKQLHIFLCFHQLLHLIPYFAVGIILMPFDSYACSYKNRSCHIATAPSLFKLSGWCPCSQRCRCHFPQWLPQPFPDRVRSGADPCWGCPAAYSRPAPWRKAHG